MKYYLDTCIYIDFIENRFDGLNPLGEYAFLFLKKCEKEKHQILYSQQVIYELNEQNYNLFEIPIDFKNLLKEIKIQSQDLIEANKLKKCKFIPFGDALHLILTRNSKAILVSRDKHLLNFKETKKPEELI
jgi:predicted nucleic acid-binding protein